MWRTNKNRTHKRCVSDLRRFSQGIWNATIVITSRHFLILPRTVWRRSISQFMCRIFVIYDWAVIYLFWGSSWISHDLVFLFSHFRNSSKVEKYFLLAEAWKMNQYFFPDTGMWLICVSIIFTIDVINRKFMVNARRIRNRNYDEFKFSIKKIFKSLFLLNLSDFRKNVSEENSWCAT